MVGGRRCFYVILLIYWDSVRGQDVGSPDTTCVLSPERGGGGRSSVLPSGNDPSLLTCVSHGGAGGECWRLGSTAQTWSCRLGSPVSFGFCSQQQPESWLLPPARWGFQSCSVVSLLP